MKTKDTEALERLKAKASKIKRTTVNTCIKSKADDVDECKDDNRGDEWDDDGSEIHAVVNSFTR